MQHPTLFQYLEGLDKLMDLVIAAAAAHKLGVQPEDIRGWELGDAEVIIHYSDPNDLPHTEGTYALQEQDLIPLGHSMDLGLPDAIMEILRAAQIPLPSGLLSTAAGGSSLPLVLALLRLEGVDESVGTQLEVIVGEGL